MHNASQRHSYVSVGVSRARDAEDAVREASADLVQSETCFILAFIPQHLDLSETAAALGADLSGVPVFGCTTAGQITGMGYETDALLFLAFPRANFRCSSVLIEPLNPFSITEIATLAKRHDDKFQHTAHWKRLALMLTDGLSKQEDLLVSALETVLDDVPIFGGSAGDGLKFEQTFVLHRGRFHTNAALLLLLETNLRFESLGFDHFLPSDKQFVITDADPDERIVFEINGAPAAEEYARLVDCRVEDLSPLVFSENPMLVQHHRNHYVRAINDATDAGALSFLAAIDDGLIMTLGRGREILDTLKDGLKSGDRGSERADFILGFDCVLRKLEIEQKQLAPEVSKIFRDRHVFGFNTYGEQHRGVHMNQTFVGVAFYGPDERTLP